MISSIKKDGMFKAFRKDPGAMALLNSKVGGSCNRREGGCVKRYAKCYGNASMSL